MSDKNDVFEGEAMLPPWTCEQCGYGNPVDCLRCCFCGIHKDEHDKLQFE